MSVLIIDNHDSFTYNLVQMVEQCGIEEITIRTNNEINSAEAVLYDKILLSPGPGVPAEAGNLISLIRDCCSTSDILGICLGHQAIAMVFGAELLSMLRPLHGIADDIHVTGDPGLFKSLPSKFKAGRYHSWIVSDKNLPECLEITSKTSDGIIMSIKHNLLPLRGLQFHPESVMTPYGKTIIDNWLKL